MAPRETARRRAVRAAGARLVGSRCVITGAARGIGAAIAATFRAEGADVALLDIDAGVKQAADDLGAVTAVVVDLADPVATAAATQQAIDALGGIDVLVNNAGILRITPLLDISVDEW